MKKILKFGFYIMIIIALFFVAKCVIKIIFNVNHEKDKMKYYKSENVRLNYFYDNWIYFNNIVDVFLNYPEISTIGGNKISCNSTEKKVRISNNYFLCAVKHFDVTKLDVDTLNFNLSKLSEIVQIEKNQQLNNNLIYEDSDLKFYIISSFDNAIFYTYCISNDLCINEDLEHSEKDKELIQNKIDEKWCSVYNTISPI